MDRRSIRLTAPSAFPRRPPLSPGPSRPRFQAHQVTASKSGGKSRGGDDDEDSMFMPLEEALRRLKAGQMDFGLRQATDKDRPVLLAVH